jgi:PhnB protein
VAGIPQGFHTITPQIHVTNGDKAIALYKKALGAKELHRILAPGTKTIMHACLEIGSSKLFLSDHAGQPQPPKGANSSFYIYVENIDAAHKKAVSAGMKESMPPTDMFWGDRMSGVTDPFGHNWNLATLQTPSSAGRDGEGDEGTVRWRHCRAEETVEKSRIKKVRRATAHEF